MDSRKLLGIALNATNATIENANSNIFDQVSDDLVQKVSKQKVERIASFANLTRVSIERAIEILPSTLVTPIKPENTWVVKKVLRKSKRLEKRKEEEEQAKKRENTKDETASLLEPESKKLKTPKETQVHVEEEEEAATKSNDEEFSFSQMDHVLYNSFMNNKKLKNEQIITCSKSLVNGASLSTLHGENWLNDEVINYFIFKANAKQKSHYCFTTHFYTRLANFSGKFDYEGVRKWTKNIDLLSFDKILVPVNNIIHWALVVIDLKNCKFERLDSGSQNCKDLEPMVVNLKKYLVELGKESSREWDPESWESVTIPNLPQQHNANDCGVFVCQYIKCITENMPFDFAQKDMPRIRKSMALEIIKDGITKQ